MQVWINGIPQSDSCRGRLARSGGPSCCYVKKRSTGWAYRIGAARGVPKVASSSRSQKRWCSSACRSKATRVVPDAHWGTSHDVSPMAAWMLSFGSDTGGARQLYAISSWPRHSLITMRVAMHLCRPALAWTLGSPVSFATPLAFAQHQGRKCAGVDDAAVGHLVVPSSYAACRG